MDSTFIIFMGNYKTKIYKYILSIVCLKGGILEMLVYVATFITEDAC